MLAICLPLLRLPRRRGQARRGGVVAHPGADLRGGRAAGVRQRDDRGDNQVVGDGAGRGGGVGGSGGPPSSRRCCCCCCCLCRRSPCSSSHHWHRRRRKGASEASDRSSRGLGLRYRVIEGRLLLMSHLRHSAFSVSSLSSSPPFPPSSASSPCFLLLLSQGLASPRQRALRVGTQSGLLQSVKSIQLRGIGGVISSRCSAVGGAGGGGAIGGGPLRRAFARVLRQALRRVRHAASQCGRCRRGGGDGGGPRAAASAIAAVVLSLPSSEGLGGSGARPSGCGVVGRCRCSGGGGGCSSCCCPAARGPAPTAGAPRRVHREVAPLVLFSFFIRFVLFF